MLLQFIHLGAICRESKVSSAKYMARRISKRQQRQWTRCQEGSQARSSQPRKEQEENGGAVDISESGIWLHSDARGSHPRASVFDPDQFPNNGAAKGAGGELNSPREGEAGSRRQLDDKDEISVGEWRGDFVSGKPLKGPKHLWKRPQGSGPFITRTSLWAI